MFSRTQRTNKALSTKLSIQALAVRREGFLGKSFADLIPLFRDDLFLEK